MKKYILGFLLVMFCQIAMGQTYTQTYKDKCTGEIKVATTTMVNGYATVSFYNQIRVFSPTEVMAGAVQLWITATYTAFSTMACPTNVVVQQTVQNTVTQAAASAAAAAASSAASAAASSAASSSASAAASSSASAAASSSASSAASSSASGAASSSASGAATSSASSTPPPASSSSGSSTSGGSGSSSGSSSSSSSETKTETKTEAKTETKSESKSESKTEEKKEETKSESKEEKKEESKSEEKKEEKKEESKEEKKDEKKEDKKEEKKKEEKKKVAANPMMLASDLAGTEDAEGKYAVMMSVGVSRSSLMGDKSYSATALIWSTLNQFALSGGITKMDFENGQLNAIHSYGTTFAYLKGTLMNLNGYTWIKPHPKYGTFGYNVGVITLMMQNAMTGGYDVSLSSSLVGFWMKPFPYNRKVTLTPQVFVMQSPLAWNTVTGGSTVSRIPGAMVGLGYDYKLSKRFGFSASYKAAMSFGDNFSLLNNIQIGSKMIF